MYSEIKIQCDTINELLQHLQAIGQQVKDKAEAENLNRFRDSFSDPVDLEDNNCYGTHEVEILSAEPIVQAAPIPESRVGGCRFVKGSDRLPKRNGVYHIKRYDRHKETEKRIWNFISPNMYDTFLLEPKSFEWLEEIAQPKEPEEDNKCLCVEKAGDHAGCNFPKCDRYAGKEPGDKALPVEEVLGQCEQVIEDAVFWNRRCVALTNELSSLREQLAFEKQLVEKQEKTIRDLTEELSNSKK
jgi:hypothetical protein